MWKSVIREDHEEQDESGTGFNPLYLEWVEVLIREPWLVALQDLVRWTKVWTGTEEELMKEIRFRVNREVWEAEDFPSDFEKLDHYFGVAWQVSYAISSGGLRLEMFRYDELSKEDLKGFYAPGWGPGAPILVERDGAAQPNYFYATYKLLRYEDPLLLAFLIFTDSTKFARSQARWSGSTDNLVDVLNANWPMPGINCRIELAQVNWASAGGPFANFDHSSLELLEGMRLPSSSDYRRFYARMKTCAGILLEEVGIKVSKKKETRMVREPGGEVRKTKHTRWTVEGPRWLS